MKQLFTLLLFSLIVTSTYAQDVVSIRGTVENASDDSILENVNIVNLNQVWGATTDKKGEFEIRAVVNDTLFFSYLGFKSIRVRVTNDWLSYGTVKIKMTEIGIALEEVLVKPVTLTGYIEVDARTIPIYDNYRYRIDGIGGSGYEGGDKQPSALSKVLSSVFNPADFLYNVFGKRPRQMKKLRKMKHDVYSNLKGWDKTMVARHPDRPHMLDYIQSIFEIQNCQILFITSSSKARLHTILNEISNKKI
mgnify:CR=1 FL=1